MSITAAFSAAPWVGLREDESLAIRDIVIKTKIESDASSEEIEQLARLAAKRCPAHQSLVRPLQVKNVIEPNGKDIAEFSDS